MITEGGKNKAVYGTSHLQLFFHKTRLLDLHALVYHSIAPDGCKGRPSQCLDITPFLKYGALKFTGTDHFDKYQTRPKNGNKIFFIKLYNIAPFAHQYLEDTL